MSKVAVIVTDLVEDVELTSPKKHWKRLDTK